MKIKFGYLLVFFVAIIHQLAMSQDITLKANTKSNVEVGEQFRVIYELNADGTGFTGPDFKGFSVLTGPMVSTSSSIQIVNGRMDRTFSQTYTYIITASKEGSFTIDPASISFENKKYVSNKLSVNVGPATVSNQSGNSGQMSSSQDQSGGISTKDLYIKALTDKKTAVLGEQVIVTYRIYTRIPVSSLQVTKLSAFPGFWTKNLLDDKTTLQQSTQVIDGEEYVLADVRKVALFPQKTGRLTIEPMELECVAQIRSQNSKQRTRDPFESFFNDPFFNQNFQNVPKKLFSDAITIEVEQTPVGGKPQSFSGAVGQFGFQSACDRDEITANEAVNISFTISGSGNLELIELPKPVFPSDFEVYEPKITTDIKANLNGVSGTRKIEYLLIPRFQGTFKIDPIEFSYFDPKKKDYVSLKSQSFNIKVNKGTGDANRDAVVSTSQEGIRYIGSDIRHIKLENKGLKPKGSYFFGSGLYYLFTLGSILLFAALVFWMRKQEKLNQNQSLVRNRQATKIAKKRLSNAQKHLSKKEQNDFYTEMSQALWGYLSDKFTIPRSELSFETVNAKLIEKQAPADLIEQFTKTLNNCEYARFAPGEVGKKMEDLYSQGIEVITKSERLIK